ncbi:MAG: site-2 protease family protein [Pseudomonadota bacterium]
MLTAGTTTAAGGLYGEGPLEFSADFFIRGLWFSVPLMFVLLMHEMGHYLAGRLHNLNVTLPYFLPAMPPVGTFGAFIKIRSLITNRNMLMDVGASGPLAGSIAAMPLLIAGLYHSKIAPHPEQAEFLSLGSSLILELLVYMRFGEFSSNLTISLHPTAMAAWFGLFVTALNLLPIGQLDGGHVVYALFGPRAARVVSYGAFAVLIPLGIMTWPGWLVFGALLVFLGLKHPPPLDPATPLQRGRRIMGWVCILLFILTFIPVPIQLGP